MDEKRTKRNNAVKVLVLLGGAVIYALSWVSGFLPTYVYENKIVGLFLFVAIVFAVMMWHIFDLAKENSALKSNRPNVTAVRTLVKTLPVTEYLHKEDSDKNLFAGTAVITSSYIPGLRQTGSTASYDEDSDKYAYGAVVYENRKIEGKEIVTALVVHGKMFFYDEQLDPLKNEVEARWADTQEPAYSWLSPREKSYYLEMDIPAGAERELCVVLKHKNDDDCYVFNYETYTQNKLKRREASVAKGIVFVKIVLRGANTIRDTVSWFKLNNPGRGFDFTFDLIGDPQKGNSG